MQKCKIKFIIGTIIFLISLSFVTASSKDNTLNNALINISDKNASIQINETIYFDTLIVQNDSVYFERLRPTDAARNTLTFNATNLGNATYFHNSTQQDIPLITENKQDETWTISNGLNTQNAEIELLLTSCGSRRFTYTSSTGTFSQEFDNPTCSNGLTELSITGIEAGSNSISAREVVTGLAGTILRNVLIVFIAIAIIAALLFPIINAEKINWTTKEWINYFVVALITVLLLTVLIKEIANIT